MIKVLFLSSGDGGNLRFLYKAITILKLKVKIVGVLADRNCGAIEFAKSNNIKSSVYNFKNDYELIIEEVKNLTPTIIVTNIHKILPDLMIHISDIKFLNLHYSRLPLYKGLIGMKTLDAAYADKQDLIGGSCHLVTSEVDGGEILGQSKIKVKYPIIDKSINLNLVFRSTAYLLLNEILATDESVTDSIEIMGQIVEFKPPLRFNPCTFTENFWKNL